MQKKGSIAPGRALIWYANYGDSDFMEYQNGEFQDFYSIDKERLKEFGLIDHYNRFVYSTDTGTFNLNGNLLEFSLKEGDSIIPLTSCPGVIYNDCISYKKGSMVVMGAGQGVRSIAAYYYGWKAKVNGIYTTIIFEFPVGSNTVINVTLVPDREINGNLMITKEEKPLVEKAVKLKAGMKNIFNLSIK